MCLPSTSAPNLTAGDKSSQGAEGLTPCPLEATGQGTGLKPLDWWPQTPKHQPPRLTLRTDTRKMQGSSRPVAGLALILHTKVNLFRHRTQFSCTSSLQGRQRGEHKRAGEHRYQRQDRPLGRRQRSAAELSIFTLYHKVTVFS